MSIDEFIAKNTEVDAEFPGVATNQCMALLHLYLRDVLGITDERALANPSASEVFTNYENEFDHDKFELIANTPEGVPQKGDIMVYGEPFGAYTVEENGTLVTKYDGHVDIFVDGDVNQYNAFSANDPIGSKPHIINHPNYTGVLGWLRFKPQEVVETTLEAPNTYKGLDLTNQESVKAAIDAWSELASGKYILQSEHDAAVKNLADELGVVPEMDVMKAKIDELKNKPVEVQTQEVVKEVPADPSTLIDPAKAASHPQAHSLWQELLSFLRLEPSTPDTSSPDVPQE